MERQQVLAGDGPPALFVAIDEGVLRREIGGPEIMKAQLARLLDLAAWPGISLQVIPASARSHSGLAGPLILASFEDAPDVAFLDTALAGQLVERREDVCAVAFLFDTLRGAALPCPASAELIEEVMAAWS